MKRIISFSGVILALIILLAVIYLIPEPTVMSKTLTLFGTALAIVSFSVWVRS